ncbi:MAG: UDP-glucose 4-epimerase GalE [Planctomycetes bacterium]|nr:UDP-glucose 4-epimerase GalE [Planctomycetota bacterium]
MNILVCGGAGYIGSNMTAVLAGQGHNPIVYDNLSKGHKSAVRNAKFIHGDLADFDLLVKTLTENEIEAVMHFAAFIEVAESVKEPERYHQNNVCNTQNLLNAMEKAGVGKFVFSSTAAVYGEPEEIPITENCPRKPINPYGQTKLDVEKICHGLAKAGKLRYAALRYFNACGAGSDGTLGEHHNPESHLIPLVIAAAMGKREDIKIFGTDYETPDGTCVRDYIHIEDLCSAHLLALDKLSDSSELVFNLGNGQGYSVREVIETVKKVSGRDFKVTETERRPGDPPVLTADATKALNELGWKTKFPELEKIVETAWKWHSENPDGYPD